MLVDSFHRHITYLRLSLTDRCNLRCRYCMPEGGVEKLDHSQVLTYEEFLRVAQAAASAGVTKIRLTGGEPLVRKDIINFIRELARVPGVLDLRLTTNGVLLPRMARNLLQAGIKRVNVSLDSLDRETYRRLTGCDEFETVWRGIETALAEGFDQVKINCVPIRGYNEQEILDFARLTLNRPLEVRFIEFMPLGYSSFWSEDKVVSALEIKEQLSRLGELTPEPRRHTEGPAQVYRLTGAKGAVGFISPITDHFCGTCNRLRLTADGKLRLCLLSRNEIDLKSHLRNGAGPEEIVKLLEEAVRLKPKGHPLDKDHYASGRRTMNLIGG
ncbi:MAG: GTP 3',8-cyclase MoaA [Thermodesulfobacteriota bacterium]